MNVTTPASEYGRQLATQLRSFGSDLTAIAHSGIVPQHQRALLGTEAAAPLRQLDRNLALMHHPDNPDFAARGRVNAPIALRDALVAVDRIATSGDRTPISHAAAAFDKVGAVKPTWRAADASTSDFRGFRTSRPGEPFGAGGFGGSNAAGATVGDDVRYADTGGVKPTFNGFVTSFVADLRATTTVQMAEGKAAQATGAWRSFLGG